VSRLRPGPDPADLHGKALDAYRAVMPDGYRADFAISPLDRLDVPVWTAALWPADGGPFCNGVGYGLDDVSALTSAYGEMVEAVGVFETVSRLPRERASYKDLVRDIGEGNVLDPVAACLPAGSGYTPDETELEWLPMRRYPDGAEVLVPVELAASRFADLGETARAAERLFTPITNGLGAGLVEAQALDHAVLELLQRDGNGVSFRAMDRGMVVETDEIKTEGTRDLLRRLEAEGIDVQVKLTATDFGMPNLYVVGSDRDGDEHAAHPLTATACGEAVHPDRETALRKALTEFCSSRARKPFNHGPLDPIYRISPPGYLQKVREQPLGSEEDRSLEAMLGWLSRSHDELKGLIAPTVFKEESRVAFSKLPTTTSGATGNYGALLDLLHGRLSTEGFEVLYLDVSPRGAGSDGGVRAVKAVVPGLEVETMSYGRIGARNLKRLLDRDAGLVGLGDPPEDRPRAQRVLLTEEREAELGGPAWFDYEAADRVVGDLYPLYREPGRHVAALAAERRGHGVR
jgi:ribosomal protein S12 methylthiotransferase accessory factor